MIPLMPTVALAFFSLCCSAFVILRIILSILPRRYLGRRVYPLTFSPSSHYLPPADKSYVWLALCDVVAVSVFVWEAFAQSTGAGAAFGVGSAARLWLALTFRQTCFLVVSALILIHVRLRRSVSFGRAHWLLWVPFVLLASVSTIAAVLFAHHTTTTSRRRFLIGYVAYSSTIAILNTVMFGSLVGSLITMRRSLANSNQVTVSKGSKSPRQIVGKPQVSLATQDIDAVREGGSWITSPASSHRHRDKSISPYSHSTTRTRATQSMAASPEREQAATAPFPFWPSQGTRSSASPRTPPSNRGDTYYEKTDFGPVHRYRTRTQSLRAAAATAAALTLSSQGSWISSSLGAHPTLSAWSYPSTPHSSPRDRVRSKSAVQPAIASTPTRDMSPGTTRSGISNAAMGGSVRARVLASDGHYAPSVMQAERGSATAATAGSPQIEISTLRIIAWLAGVWVPLVLSLPYVTSLHSTNLQNDFRSTFFAVSVAISAPILALNFLLRHPIEIPYDVFDEPTVPRPILRYVPSIGSASTSGERYRRGNGTRLVAGHHSTGAWLLKSGAVGGKRYRTHFPRVLAPAPRISILPEGDQNAKGRLPIIPCQAGSDWHLVRGAEPAAFLPSPQAPTRVASRRRSSTHPHYITPGQHVAPIMIPHDLTDRDASLPPVLTR